MGLSAFNHDQRVRLAPWLHILLLSLLSLAACAPQTKVVRPDWQTPSHKLVNDQIVPLLRAAGRSPATCKVFFLDTGKINALSAGECRFGFTTGLVNTGDAQLIRGIAAHEVAHEVLGHADKRKAAAATEQIIRTGVSLIPGVGGLIASSAVLVAGMFALPAYSRSQEAEADAKAVEILRSAQEPDPAGTMAYSFRKLLAHAEAKGGGLLDSHPGTEARLEAMLNLQRQESPPEASPSTAAAQLQPAVPAGASAQAATSSPAQSTERPPGEPSGAAATATPEGREGASSVTAMVKSAPLPAHPSPSQAAGELVPLGRGTDPREGGGAVVFIYQEGSAYSKRMEEILRGVAGGFAGRVTFFRSEVSGTDPELVGSDPETLPILVVLRNGKEQGRMAGLPPRRRSGETAEEALTEWVTECLNQRDD